MNETFEIIEKLPKGQQLSILLELLDEQSGMLAILRSKCFFERQEELDDYINKGRVDCEIIKERIKQLYNEKISNELPVQNIAQP